MFDMNPELMDQLIQRELKQSKAIEEFMPKPPAPSPPTKPLNPKVAMLLGGAADAASTYKFLKDGSGRESNPMFSYFNGRPWAVIPTAAAAGLGYNTLHSLIKKKSPKVADTIAGLLGGHQMALAGHNVALRGNSALMAQEDLNPNIIRDRKGR